MTTKILKLKEPFNCPFRYAQLYPQLSYVEWINKGKPRKTYMWLCSLKKGIVCSSSNVFCDACPLEDAE